MPALKILRCNDNQKYETFIRLKYVTKHAIYAWYYFQEGIVWDSLSWISISWFLLYNFMNKYNSYSRVLLSTHISKSIHIHWYKNILLSFTITVVALYHECHDRLLFFSIFGCFSYQLKIEIWSSSLRSVTWYGFDELFNSNEKFDNLNVTLKPG